MSGDDARERAGLSSVVWTQQALDALPVAGYAVDREYRYRMFNPAYATAMREAYGAEIAIGASVFDYVSVDGDRAQAKANMDRVLAGEQLVSSAWYGDESKSRRLVSLFRSPIRDDGEVIGIAAVALDETERTRTERDLVESRRFAQSILDTSPNLIYIYDLVEHRNVYANREVSEFLGYTPEQIAEFGSSLFVHILHPDDAERVAAHHATFATARDEDMFEIEYRMKHSGGEWRWLRSRDVLFARDGDGAARQILGSTEDSTERKRAEEALRESEERYRALVEAVRDTVFVIGRDDRIEFVNDAAAAWMRTSPQGLIGKTRSEVFPADNDWSAHQAASLARVFETGEPLYIEYPARFPGGVRWQATSLAPLRGADGSISAVLGIGRDITDRKQAEERRVGELEHLAHADALTGLLNRRGFDLLAAQAVEQAARADRGIGIIYCDMDGLKTVNDECGHAAGDQALRDAATILSVTLRSADVVARTGGDEFVVLAVGESGASLGLLVDRIQQGVDVFNSAHERSRPLGMSCGVAWRGPGERVELGRLVAEADAAMYREKARRAQQ